MEGVALLWDLVLGGGPRRGRPSEGVALDPTRSGDLITP